MVVQKAGLLIELYGIETGNRIVHGSGEPLLIELYGIETRFGAEVVPLDGLLIELYGIETQKEKLFQLREALF